VTGARSSSPVDYTYREPRSTAPQWRAAALVAAAIAAVELLLLVVASVAIFGKPFADSVEKKAQTSAAHAKATHTRAPHAKATPANATHAKAAAEKAPKVAHRAKPKPVAPPANAAQLPRGKTTVLVLNGNGHTGAAGEAASVIHSVGYRISATGNARRMDFPRSIVMFRPGFKGEAQRLAKDVRVTSVTPLDGMRPSDLGGAQLVLIVGG
jgi:LytR cell envelope-related transcriptional attenuator